jgi:hypothetical protein
MKRSILFTVIIISFSASISYSQVDCKVLLPAIGVSYTGSCKQGLAHGKGEAVGTDHYLGDFRKGLPDGSGTYFWLSGERYEGEWKRGLREGRGTYTFLKMGKDTSITGLWREDKYIGEKEVLPYVIEYRNSIGRVTCMRVGDRPYVKYKFSRNGGESNNINGLLLQGSSGSESNTAAFTGFEQVTFPFNGKVRFTAPNAFNMAMLTCEVRLTINKPGSWIVTLFY